MEKILKSREEIRTNYEKYTPKIIKNSIVLQNNYLHWIFEIKWRIAHNLFWVSVFLKEIKNHKVFCF